MKNSIINRFFKYVQISSPSQNEKEFAELLVKDLEELGFDIFFDNSMESTGSNVNNIIAKLKGDKEVEPIIFSAHMDTVNPCQNIIPILENGLIKSKTDTILSADDKSGIVAIIEGVKYILDNKISHGDIELVFTVCEEIGLQGSSNLDFSLLEAKKAFVLDSSGNVGDVITRGPAQVQLEVAFHGKTAHAGVNPEKGINAIQVAARAIDNMELLRIDEETTANLGYIKGGSVTNIVPDYVELKFECRSLDKIKLETQTKKITESLRSAAKDFKAEVVIDTIEKYPSFSLENDSIIVQTVVKALKRLNITPNISSSGGGSDANIFNGQGIDAVNLSTGMSKVHTTDEYISVENLLNSSRLVASIIESVE